METGHTRVIMIGMPAGQHRLMSLRYTLPAAVAFCAGVVMHLRLRRELEALGRIEPLGAAWSVVQPRARQVERGLWTRFGEVRRRQHAKLRGCRRRGRCRSARCLVPTGSTRRQRASRPQRPPRCPFDRSMTYSSFPPGPPSGDRPDYGCAGSPVKREPLSRFYFPGLMFWFTRNRFVGSYRFLIFASRS